MKHSKTAIASSIILLVSLMCGSAFAAGIKNAPAPFDKGDVPIALIDYISGGDFFRAFESGARKQAKALGVDLRVFPGKEDAALQRDQIQQAINLNVKAIVINHGLPESIKDVVKQALDAGIKVVAFDVNIDHPQVPQVEQSDKDLAQILLDQAIKDNGKSFKAGYVYVPGFAPLDRRDAVWSAVKKANPGILEKARWGTVNAPVPTSIAAQANAALRANPDISVVIAPWDEFARGTKLAANELGVNKKLKIYSADISTSDISEIREPSSPWVATAATNPAVVGAVSIRAAALLVAGKPVPHNVVVKPVLVTRADLEKYDIKTVEELSAKLPEFGKSDAVLAPWIPQPN
ncbi:substrate-binding domain-containing protein [Uliginosibacterium gangwonense]|uniref:substrate-binding domain-containing protein n=1 Tax=Uliginosibacterium gangwonense TaxID=392736 RepID=UPI0003734DEA|nr:substrate-binding domain-containing protein [Uliginosibacterium gangwonense]